MSTPATTPTYLFESSWEVCNKVGGIYTVLSTKAFSLKKIFDDKAIFIGPDIWEQEPAVDFIEDNSLFAEWREYALTNEQLKVRIGRWNVPGNPSVILVDFKPFSGDKDSLFFSMWETFRVNSLNAYGDYDESCIFAYAVGKVIESFYSYYKLEKESVVAHFNEWMLGMGALYLQKQIPEIATIFTTHATSIGRSIAGNNKALYAYMDGYNGDQMAYELNMEAKHSLEKQTALHVDCFTTVSDITAVECKKLLDKEPDVVTPNGFELNFVPEGDQYSAKRKQARAQLIRIAEKLIGSEVSENAILVSTSGRYEYRNKGLDIFIDAMGHIRTSGELQREIIAFIMVPGHVYDARADLKEILKQDYETKNPLQAPFVTHWLYDMEHDKIISHIRQAGFTNNSSDKIKIIFVPCYLSGSDGIFNTPYYDLLIGMDATVYPSYYEPWGYTPMESIAFGIPTITTNLAGFGLWAKHFVSGNSLSEGVMVLERTDFNYFEVTDSIAEAILELSRKNKSERTEIHKHCFALSREATWSKFILHYQESFHKALVNKDKRIAKSMVSI